MFTAIRITVRLKPAKLPDGASWQHIYGVALLCSIGFTMSLFIGLLAFPAVTSFQEQVKVGVLSGPVLSGARPAGTLVCSSRTTSAGLTYARASESFDIHRPPILSGNRSLLTAIGAQSGPLIRASRSDQTKLYSYFNNIRVRSFILNGAPNFHHSEQNCEHVLKCGRAALKSCDRDSVCCNGDSR